MHHKKPLRFTALRGGLSDALIRLPDTRQPGKIKYSLHDSVTAAFACMHFQDPSLPQFQQRLRQQSQRDNLATLFGITKVPEATQLRALLDPLDPDRFRPLFSDYFARLQRGKYLEKYQLVDGLHVVTVDGTQFFCSQNVSRPHCLETHHHSGDISYSHKMVHAALVHPDRRHVFPLIAEEIKNADGATTQDCEIAAAKRLIPKLRADHPRLKMLLVGDDLYAHQPFIALLQSHDLDFLWVAKPDSPAALTTVLTARAQQIATRRRRDKRGRHHHYEWLNDVPLTAAPDAPRVNVLRDREVAGTACGQDEVTYTNTWITSRQLTAQNVVLLARAGRARWKIENECFNTLKNHGYHLEHNFGHGRQHLSFIMMLLTPSAFFWHQIFELTDPLFQRCRQELGGKRHLWENLRRLIRPIVFERWESLLTQVLAPVRYRLVPIDAPG